MDLYKDHDPEDNLFLQEYGGVGWLKELKRDEDRVKRVSKGYRDIEIWVEAYDVYSYFKKTLLNSYKEDKASLKQIVEEPDMKIVWDHILRCKRVRIAGKEQIRLIY